MWLLPNIYIISRIKQLRITSYCIFTIRLFVWLPPDGSQSIIHIQGNSSWRAAGWGEIWKSPALWRRRWTPRRVGGSGADAWSLSPPVRSPGPRSRSARSSNVHNSPRCKVRCQDCGLQHCWRRSSARLEKVVALAASVHFKMCLKAWLIHRTLCKVFFSEFLTCKGNVEHGGVPYITLWNGSHPRHHSRNPSFHLFLRSFFMYTDSGATLSITIREGSGLDFHL